jgi:DNA-binding FrmR family transcriptional regulator
VEHEFVEGRLLLRRTPEEREPILNRLRRIEGQVRGLQQMVEQDRYCGDELQQANAVLAALREVVVLITTQHLMAGAEHMAQSSSTAEISEDLKTVLRGALRQV